MNTAPVYGRAAANNQRLAQANGCDQPVSARDMDPKTPAARERVCLLGAATKDGGDTAARGNVRCGEVA